MVTPPAAARFDEPSRRRAATVTGNIIEENIVTGNSDGIILFAGAAGNLLRRNFVMGNPGVEASIDHPSATTGFDIRNLAAAGANEFIGNTCLTSLNGPCPSLGPSLTANPNPVPVTDDGLLGITTISWLAQGAEDVEVHVGSPDGDVFLKGGSRGSGQTGLWVRDGMTFYLQDVSGGKPLTAENTLATVVVRFQRR
jgi:parallel beta-helix repeat protein